MSNRLKLIVLYVALNGRHNFTIAKDIAIRIIVFSEFDAPLF